MATFLEIETYKDNGLPGTGMSLVLESVSGIETSPTWHGWGEPGDGSYLYHVHTAGGDILVDKDAKDRVMTALAAL